MIRVLLLADTHLGFDLPFRPRIKRRRRGHDFFANYKSALQPAVKKQVDLVVHGGDLFFRTRVPSALVDMALEPLVRVAELGVPVYLVPGNHESSRIPMQLFGYHPNLHIFDQPRTYGLVVNSARIVLAGFPFARKVRDEFRSLVHATGHQDLKADVRLLCFHQAVEGAQVGPSDFTFRRGDDVISGRDIGVDFEAVLAGHIHRAQVLTHDLNGKKLDAPVIYPGSIDRTSFAERYEEKGYYLLAIDPTGPLHQDRLKYEFVRLPARPMVNLHISSEDFHDGKVETCIAERLVELDPDSIVRVHIDENIDPEIISQLSAARLREIAPESMNVDLATPSRFRST